jgi:hypothetical protein
MNSRLATLATLAALTLTTGQAQARLIDGDQVYTPPATALPTGAGTRDYPASFDKTWKAVVAHLSDTAFVIDTIDKASGLIAISFSLPDAREDVDCGSVTSWVKNLRGRRDYQFNAASPNETYEFNDGGTLVSAERHFEVSGKINIFVTEQSPASTRVKVMVRYVATNTGKLSPEKLDMNFQRVQPHIVNNTISFNSGQEGQFPRGTICRPRGTLEAKMLDGFAAGSH